MGAAASKPKTETGELLSISEIARRCKLDRATTRSRLDDLGYEPDPSSTEKNQLYLFDDELLFQIKAAKDSLTAAKIRQTRAQAEKIEMQNAEARRELVPMAEAVEIAQRLVNAIYQEFAVRQPKRIAPKLAKAKNVTAVRIVLKTDTDRIMKGLRENFGQFAEIK